MILEFNIYDVLRLDRKVGKGKSIDLTITKDFQKPTGTQRATCAIGVYFEPTLRVRLVIPAKEIKATTPRHNS
jgi:hypothetical protein